MPFQSPARRATAGMRRGLWFSSRRGFALVVTLSMMVLLAILAVGLLSLGTISLRAADSGSAQAVARSNARLAMMLAIGQLQQHAGPDQRVTGTAPLGASNPASIPNPAWTGVWHSDQESVPPVWLVSGDTPDPSDTLTDQNSALLSNAAAGAEAGEPAEKSLRAAWVEVNGTPFKSRYAYWIGDEGTKARVDIARPNDSPTDERERLVRAQSPQENGISKIDGTIWAGFESGGSVDKSALHTLGTVALAATSSGVLTRAELPRRYLHDLTTGGFGLPVNVAEGGMKVDLSLLLDRSQQSKSAMLRHYIGGSVTEVPASDHIRQTGAKIYQITPQPTVAARKKFYLSDQISNDGTVGAGPNWGILWNYARLWENVKNQQIPLVGATPRVDSDLRDENWLPYAMSGTAANRRDHQHVNSSVAPVVSTFQMGFRLGAEEAPKGPGDTSAMYYATLEIKPLIGLWNPYNINISPRRYKFEWAAYPYLRFDYQMPPLKMTSANVITTYMRERWGAGGGGIPTPGNTQASSWIQMITDKAVDFQPGEFRMFSIDAPAKIEAYGNRLVSGWGEKGAFKLYLLRPNNERVKIPAGYVGWFGDVYLQDTHHQDTINKFPKLNPTAASSWITFKSISDTGQGDIHLTRYTNLWNGGTNPSMGRPFMPEQIISTRTATDTGKTKHRIEDLARADNVAHIGTWSFHSRTTTQVMERDQGLRGWIDTNPRALVGLPKYDGSMVRPQRTGWNTVSPFLGGSHDRAPRGQIGDGDGGDRGLIAEGGAGEPEPQAISAGGRYQGFGGPSNTATGQTHVIVYDVPHAPLQSLGQFQHAELSRYNFEPGFVVGNSYANPRIPLDGTVANRFAKIEVDGTPFNLADISHDVNSRLWDTYFFSTLGIDYLGTSGKSFDSSFGFGALAGGTKSLPNPRMIFVPLPGDSSIDRIINSAGIHSPEAIATRIRIAGAFNVNSLSKTAWKAILSTMDGSELPVIDPQTKTRSWETPEGIRFNRFGHVIHSEGYDTGSGGDDPAFWQGWRNISEDELDELAAAIVDEVRERGPFRTMAEFVNRNPDGKFSHQKKGAIQAAIDAVANASLPASVGTTAIKPKGSFFSNAVNGDNLAAGHAAYLLQGDVLQSLAPIMQVRSDYFRIRTCGEALGANGRVVARAWCEAFVQRLPQYADETDAAHIPVAGLTSETNRTFGRRFEMVSFRWLSPAEI